MPNYKINDKDYPIVVVEFDTHKFSMADTGAYFNDLEAMFNRTTGRFAAITVLDESPKSTSGELNKVMNEGIQHLKEKYNDRLVAEYIVLNGLMSRIFFKAASVVVSTLKQTVATASLAEAISKAREALSRHAA
ncbi:MAG: hypothetical protein MUC87_08160 [Bacteroidia bacterium]|jgi:hypothetical protein|nr:hypothetical protein [Bacteroidia bacterium]